MTATASNLTTASIEQTLMLPSWGKWAAPRYAESLGVKPQGWQGQYTPPWPDEASDYIPPIDDEYAERLDAVIARLPENERQVIVCLYVYRKSINRATKILRRSRHAIRQQRDAALNKLYGSLGE